MTVPARGQAPGKIILFGEHAVVYGRPALAIPLDDLQATVSAQPGEAGQGVVIEAGDVGQRFTLRDSPGEPLADAAELAGRLEPHQIRQEQRQGEQEVVHHQVEGETAPGRKLAAPGKKSSANPAPLRLYAVVGHTQKTP